MDTFYIQVTGACSECGMCEINCHTGAIADNGNGARTIDKLLCTKCKECVNMCPAECIKEVHG